jgi:hypothetical protein
VNKAAIAAVHHHKATEAVHLPVVEKAAKEVKAVRDNKRL